MIYKIYKKLVWNQVGNYLLKRVFEQKDSFYWGYIDLLRFLDKFKLQKGFNFMEKEWDNLILLDACRFDVFKKFNNIDGKLTKINSLASHTREWIKKYLKRRYSDIVIVTANPNFSKIKLKELTGNSNPFYHIEPVWDYGWDDKLNTVPPWVMNDVAKKIIKKYPNKRKLFWFIQPHNPFIGKTKALWCNYKSEKAEIQNTWNAYIDNLILVLKYVNKLIGHLNGKTFITSDHGNCFGELFLFGHPPGIHIPPLIEVPWLEVNTN